MAQNMSSDEDEDMDYKYFPETSERTKTNVIPPLSKVKYDKVYDDLQKWNKKNGEAPVTQNLLLKYFMQMSEKNKPSTLWAYYSMIKATLRTNDNIDITSWSKLLDFLKRNNRGYKPDKSKLFTEEEIEQFIDEAPDENWLDVKVVCIFGISGAFSANKLGNIQVEHIKQYDNMYWVIIPNAETKHSFTITGTFFNIVQKYAALRPKNARDNRFFLQYSEGKCSEQALGKNQFTKMPRKIAKFLNLPHPEQYTGLSFRIPTAVEFLARHSVSVRKPSSANMSTAYASKSNSVPESGPQQHNERHIDMDEDIEYSLDYETGLLKTSSVSCTIPSMIATSSTNDEDTAEHVCTSKCSQVKCAKEDSEKNVLHAFTLMKPPDYAITEVIPAQFASDPTCRWMVAYSHFIEPVTPVNADEKFDEITKSIPNNVKVIQKYVRCNSSSLFAAYVVVYGVKCRCQKPVFGPFSPQQPPDTFRKQSFDPLTAQNKDSMRKQNFDPLSAEPSDELPFSIEHIKCEG